MPDGWSVLRLGNAVEIKHGFAFPGSQFSADPRYPTVVTPGNFRIGGGFQQTKIKTFSGDVPDGFVLERGDLIVTMTDLSKTGDTLGYPAFVPGDRTYLHNQRIGRVFVRDRRLVDLRYLALVMQTSSYRAYVLATASGSTVRHTSPSRILDYETPFPPLEEQQRIARVLGVFDDLIDTNFRLIQSCTAVTALVFTQLIDNATKSVAFSETVEILSGGTPRTSEPAFWEEGSIPWFSVTDTPAEGEVWVLDTSKHITELGLEKSSAQLLESCTTIVTARGTVGNVALVGVPMAMNQSCYGLRSIVGGRGYFTFFATLSSVEALRRRAHGSVFDTITRASFNAIDIPLPPTDEIEAFESLVDPLMKAARELLWESDALRRTRDELLPLLLSGRVRVEEVAA